MFTLLAAAPQQGQGGGWSMMIMIVLMFAIIYFFMIKPQKKRQKEIENFRNGLKVGDKVLTASGVYGVVKDLHLGEPYMTVEIAKGVVVKIDRNYVYADSTQASQDAQATQSAQAPAENK